MAQNKRFSGGVSKKTNSKQTSATKGAKESKPSSLKNKEQWSNQKKKTPKHDNTDDGKSKQYIKKNSWKNKKEDQAEKPMSKSKQFWDKQKQKADLKRNAEVNDEIITVPREKNDGWQSGSDVEIVSETEELNEEDSDVPKEVVRENSSEDDAEDSQEDDDVREKLEYAKQMQSVNRKGLSYPVYKAVINQGYKIPTPIQRKAIPDIIDGKDVVAMARTGSGKTAAFLIPMVEKLKAHSVRVGARGLILSPSRELATQTLKFARDFCKNTDIKCCAFVGGDNMDDQFSTLASNPDVIIATPGRLMHLIIESNLDLQSVEYVVFDEADRLFEMGFAEQLREILAKLPSTRQTLLFSATLPKLLIDFARAGLESPTLIRLDVDCKISRDLQMYFFSVKHEDKEGTLLYLLRHSIPMDQQTVIFVSTKHHVEYIQELLKRNGFSSTYIYGSLDQAARKTHLARFRHGKVKILVVTDVAARGIDIPLLDNVVNYDFPASSKIFVHRVGRTARAGKSGSAWSLVTATEVPFMLDLQLFTGRPLVFSSSYESTSKNNPKQKPQYTTELVYGLLPPTEISLECESFTAAIKGDVGLESLRDSARNAYKMYLRSRPTATKASHQRSKEISIIDVGIHPFFDGVINDMEMERFSMVKSISNFRPSETIFEVGKRGGKSAEAVLMGKRRNQFSKAIIDVHSKRSSLIANEQQKQRKVIDSSRKVIDEEDLASFTHLVEKKVQPSKDAEYYLNYRPQDADTEQGYAVHAGEQASNFVQNARMASMEMIADDPSELKKKKGDLRWDSNKHKFTRDTIGSDNKKRIRTENGTTVLATFKADRFEKWQKKTKLDLPRIGENELKQNSAPTLDKTYRHNNVYQPDLKSKSFARKMATLEKKSGREAKNEYMETIKKKQADDGRKTQELKSTMDIARNRQQKDMRKAKTGRHHVSKTKKT